MASSSTPALPAPPSRLLLEWKNRDAPISQDIIVHNPGQVVKALVPDVGNLMTDLDSSILEAEEAPMSRLFEFIQNILREQGQAHLNHLEHIMAYFQERDEATRFAQSLAHDDMDRRVRMLEDTLARQMAEGSMVTDDAMDLEYTKLAILPPPGELTIPIMTAVSERRFTGRKVPTDLMWSLDKVRKLRMRRDPSPRKKAHPTLSRGNTPTPETPKRPLQSTSTFPDLRPVEPLPIRSYSTPIAAYSGTPFHNIRGPREETPSREDRHVGWDSLSPIELSEEEREKEEEEGRKEAGAGGGGGREPPRGRSGAGAPDPGDSDSDSSDDEPRDWNDRRARKRWLKKRDRRLLRTIRELFDPSRSIGPSPIQPTRLPSKKSIAPEPFKGEPDDLDRFIRALEGVFELDKAHYVSDMDKISYTSSLMRDRASKWYETIHAHVNEEAAKRLGLPFDPNYPWRKCSHFLSSMTSSFGGSLTREKAVGEWRNLKHVAGKIDEFIDKSIELVMRTGYTDEVSIKDHILQCLHRDLYREWAKALDQPKQITDWLAGLRSLGHKLEQLHKLEQAREKAPLAREQTRPEPRGRDKGKGKEQDGSRKVAGSAPRGPNTSGKAKARFDFVKDKSTALAGVSPELRTKRFEGNLCTRCGDGGHKWTFCQAAKPVGDAPPGKRIAGAKRKRNSEEEGSRKRVAVLTAPVDPPPQPSVAAVPVSFDGAIMNVVDSGPESDCDLDIY